MVLLDSFPLKADDFGTVLRSTWIRSPRCVRLSSAATFASSSDSGKLLSTDAEACYDAESGKAGGGAAWADGYRTALAKAVEAAGPGKGVISESNAEAYLGSMHAFLAI